MARPSRYSPEVRERAIRLVCEHGPEHPSRITANAKRRRRQVQLPARYSHEYPVRERHDYSLDAIPLEVWREPLF